MKAGPIKVLIVCLGNICRSPMAEGWLRARIATEPLLKDRVLVDSAGLGDWHAGQPPDPRAIRTAAAHGIDIAGQRARMLTRQDFREFDLILCADGSTLRQTRAQSAADTHASIALLLEWAGHPSPCDLTDPYTGGLADFEQVWMHLDAAGDGIVHGLHGALDA